MRGQDEVQERWFSYVSLEARIPKSHPLRKMPLLVDGVLKSMNNEFSEHYSHTGCPRVAPEKLLRAIGITIEGRGGLAKQTPTIQECYPIMNSLRSKPLYRLFYHLLTLPISHHPRPNK